MDSSSYKNTSKFQRAKLD